MNLKPIKYSLLAILILIGFYSYSGLSGLAFYKDSVEKNTEFKGNRTNSGHINRFYHK